jgi:hypothetical protein
VQSGSGTVSSVTVSGKFATIQLAGVADRQALTVLMQGVVGEGGTPSADRTLPIRFLSGDVNRDKLVNSVDLSSVQSAYGLSYGNAGYQAASDVMSDGAVNSVDLTVIQLNYGYSLP